MKEVELKGVQFGYDSKKIVLEKIDLAIPNKDLVAVIGPNGGKSTLFRLIFRTSELLCKEVLVKGQHPPMRTDLVDMSPEFQLEPSFSYKGGQDVVLHEESGKRGWGFSNTEKDHSRYWKK